LSNCPVSGVFGRIHNCETDRKHRLPSFCVVETPPEPDIDVELVQWPSDDQRRRHLACSGIPRLLVVDPGVPAPTCDDVLEDWVRLPADADELASRTATLRRRARTSPPQVPRIDDDGVVRIADRWVALPPVEARIMTALVQRFGAVVQRAHLAEAGWPDGAPGRNALDVHVLRLRRRISAVGLSIRTIRSRGYLLDYPTPSASPATTGIDGAAKHG
jgi:hypothetical protein